jgi:uncharacterized cupredoxin-like copper-binding protein
MPRPLALPVLLALAIAAVAVAGAQSATTPTKVTVKLKEFKVIPSVTSVKAGKVTFVVSNVGKINHELVVLKTNVPAGKLKENKDHEVSEASSVGEVGEVDHGTTKSGTLTLKPGKYQLFCNIAAHYSAGQYTGFTVK